MNTQENGLKASKSQAKDADTEDIGRMNQLVSCCIQRVRNIENDAVDKIDERIDDGFVVRFSAAQMKVKLAQAKHEAKLAVDTELLEARKELVERRYEVVGLERERKNLVRQLEAVQKRLDAVLQENKQTLGSMKREDVKLEKLQAILDVEKAVRLKLQKSFEKQQQTLVLAQERVKKLEEQVASYQKTETVLAQSVAHLQHRFASKDEQRAASVEHVQRELTEHYEQKMAEICEELATLRGTEKMAQKQVQELQKKLHDNAQQMLVSQENVVRHDDELQAKITRLETEKAVLQSKTEQVQKADTQLRNQLHAHSEQIAALRQEKDKLQRDNKELGEIASDLMQMAERQHSENANCGNSPAQSARDTLVTAPGRTYEEDGIFLQKRKKRLRLSLS